MKTSRLSFSLILHGSTLAFTLIAGIALLVFRPAGAGVGPALLAAAALGMTLFILSILVIQPLSRLYGQEFAALEKSDATAFSSALASLGGAPLTALLRYALLLLVVLGSFAFITPVAALPADSRGESIVFLFSWGLLSASFLYVLADRLVLTTLLRLGLTSFPERLRESRQRRKTLIIPLVLALMSILYTFSSVLLFAGMNSGSGGVLLRVLPLTLLYFAVIMVLMFVWNDSTGKLFGSVIERLERISSSEKDLTSRIAIASVDEISTIAGMVNSFCAGLGESVADIRRTYDEMAGVERRLFEGIGTSSTAASVMAASIDQSIAAVELGDVAMNQGRAHADEVSRHAADMAEKARIQGASLTNSAAGVESLLASVGVISKEAAGALAKSSELVDSVREGEEGIVASLEKVSSVAARSADLAEINKLIAAVATRTNLLAMNASIEAAHAGEAGAGFSVVAEEIRTLATSTAEHTKQSKARIGEILGLIEKALAVSESTRGAFEKVRSSAEDVHRASEAIAGSMVEQERRGKELLSLLSETEALARGASEAAAALDGVARELAAGLAVAANAASDTRRITQGMRENNEELRRSTTEVDGMGARAADLHDRMASLLGSFKTD